MSEIVTFTNKIERPRDELIQRYIAAYDFPEEELRLNRIVVRRNPDYLVRPAKGLYEATLSDLKARLRPTGSGYLPYACDIGHGYLSKEFQAATPGIAPNAENALQIFYRQASAGLRLETVLAGNAPRYEDLLKKTEYGFLPVEQQGEIQAAYDGLPARRQGVIASLHCLKALFEQCDLNLHEVVSFGHEYRPWQNPEQADPDYIGAFRFLNLS